jgi:hypothetical protein
MLRLLALCFCVTLIGILSAAADQALSGTYRGTIIYTPKGGVTPYDDRNAMMSILPDTGQGPVAVVTYSDHLGRYRENCAITYNPDGTITLKGTSYTILSGSSFSLDTFTIRIGADGSLSGGSVDTSGGKTVLSLRHQE